MSDYFLRFFFLEELLGLEVFIYGFNIYCQMAFLALWVSCTLYIHYYCINVPFFLSSLLRVDFILPPPHKLNGGVKNSTLFSF